MTGLMSGKVRHFFQLAYDEGPVHAVLGAGRSLLPSPYGERCSFTGRFLDRLSEAPSSWETRFRMWRHGFYPKSYYLYDFDTHDVDAYVSDLDEIFGWTINTPAQAFLNDKQKFYDLIEERGFGDLLPTRYGTLSNGVFVGAGTDFLDFLEDERILVVKAREGGGGNEVHICTFEDGEYAVDGERRSAPSFRDRISELDGYLVTEYCDPAAYASSLYPATPNTIRIVTMNPTDGEPFVASAVHRIGSDASGTIDNFSQGGLSAEITDDGALSPAVRYVDRTVSWHDHHPDTGSQIAGTVVPGWGEIRETILTLAAVVPEVAYVGWDIIVTEDGDFKIIEANSNTDTDLLQAHGPLLRDPDVREFYREHGVISRSREK